MQPAEPSNDLAGRRIAVTGGAGFIGGALCRRLAGAGAEVVGLDLEAAAADRVLAAGADFIECDITDRPALEPALEGAEIVVHTAAIVSDWGPMSAYVRVNVAGTANVIGAARAVGAGRVVHVSSVVVYGYDSPAELDETAPRRTCGIPYIDTKSASDALACRAGAIVIRPGDVYGPGSIPWTLRPVEAIRAGRFALVGGGEGIMLPVYIDDLVEAIVAGIERGEPGRAYAAWDGEPATFGQFFNRYAEMLGKGELRRLPRQMLFAVGAAMEASARLTGRAPTLTRNALTLVSRRGTVSTRRIREELGWEPKVPLDEGMRRTEAWLRAEGLL